LSAARKRPCQLPRPGPATFEVDETTLVFAFRYALGRQSTAPSHVANMIRGHWSRLEPWTQKQIHREIEEAIRLGEAGWDCDVETWRGILALPVKLEA
jgi:hypothetical protein